jgi:stage III sporulation protein AB
VIKLIGITLILGASTFGGFLCAERMAQRCRMLRQWLRILEMLATEIYYHSDLLPQILDRIAATVNEKNLEVEFRRMARTIAFGADSSVAEAWTALVTGLLPEKLRPEDGQVLLELGSYLGVTDREDQVKKIRTCQSRLEGNLAGAELEVKKRTNLYRYLGFAAGAIVVLWLL